MSDKWWDRLTLRVWRIWWWITRSKGVPLILVAHEHEFHQLAVDLENEVRAENTKLREFFEAVFEDAWDLCVADGGDLQDTAERLGLIVKVPADEQFRDEYDGDEMFVWSWSPLATEALSHHLPPDDGDTG